MDIRLIALIGLAAIAGFFLFFIPHKSKDSAYTEANLKRTSQEASIEVTAVFLNPLMKPQESKGQLQFKVTLDSHSVDLMQFDLTKLATVRTNTSINIVTSVTWKPSDESSHHRAGTLTVLTTFDEKAEYIELEMKGIGIPSRVFRWELRKS